jgi:type IV pilus assembly protein PilY1
MTMHPNQVFSPMLPLPQTAPTTLAARIADLFVVRWLRQNALVLVAAPLVAAVSFMAFSQSSAPNIPAIALSADPLYAATSGDKPTLALALSVEFPTVGAQYVDPDNNNSSTTDDVTYSPSIEYLGYYDAESCYTYDDAGTGAPSGQTSSYKRFVRRGPAIALATPNTTNPTWTSRMCWDGSKSYSKDDGTTPAYNTTSSDGFSGNFLNWASSSAIDMLRLSLTGGDRVIDTATLTVLQRAVIPDGDPISMGNSSNFPSKRLYRSGTSRAITSTNFAAASYASSVPYFGAVPSIMVSAAGSNDIFVANTLNRIYFGTTRTSSNNVSSSGLTGYTVGSGGASTYQVGSITNSSAALPSSSNYQMDTLASSGSKTSPPSGTTFFCANQNSTCALPAGTWQVWYGKSGSWKYAAATGAVPCDNPTFGYSSSSSMKCYYKANPSSNTWTPQPNVTLCASENGTCTLPSGTWEVLYGAGTSWKVAPATGAVPCSNGVFGDPAVGTGKNCYYRAYTGSWTPTTTTNTTLNSDGYFFARVQVCDRDASTYALKDKRFWSLCTQYSDGASTPHASYKPTGVVQKYSDQLRLAAFGYLLDQTTSRYGGVLRAPMKYVGAKTFDTSVNLASSANPNMEWDSTTGVFNLNPDSNTTIPTTDGRAVNLSGVINYVNQFGRTGSVAGRYKKYDPIGELHYQAVRYLQFLQPSAAAVSSITPDMYDGYPVFTTWADPYGSGRSNTADYSCLKSNIVVIGDKNTWDYNNRLPTASAANNIPDIAAWQTVVSKFESNTSGTYLDGAGVSRTIANPNTANSAAVTSASGDVSLVGTAYWARTHDIRGTGWTNATAAGTAGTTLQRPGLRVKTFVFDVNEYGASNDATARRSSNQLFRAAKYGGFEADPSNTAKNPYNTYGNPFVNEKDGTNNNYVWSDTDPRPSRVGEANTYFLQSDARGVLSAFDDIFSRASTTAYNIGGGANNNKNTFSTNSTIYQGKFDTSDWSGDLEARLTTTTALVWSAATQLNALTAPASSRTIVVGKVGATASPTATDFSWSAIEPGLQSNLNAGDGLGQDRLNYLRGDKSKEGSPFRKRSKVLGDIINSGVVYSGQPSTQLSSSSYASFASTNASRTPAVFVGANDGMLHGFNANTGDELFAYIPSWLGPKLAALTNASYGASSSTPHQSYVDSMPAVAEAQIGSAGTAADWKTVLIGGTGGGGQGVFALDVTDPTNFSASNVMWEFTHTDDADLGNVTGKPQILKLRTNAYNAATPTFKWFAVVGSGVNNYVADSAGLYSSTGNPALFLIDLSKPAGTAWSLGSNYYKIPLPVNSTLSASKPTGLINFTAELGVSGEVALIYTGDLHGNVWKLDFTLSAGASEWNINKLSSFNNGTVASPNPYPLFIAKDGSGNVQPITAAPLVAPGPDAGTRYVYFGTGKYYEVSDKSSTATQTEYMVFDTGATSGDTLTSGTTRAGAISGRVRLKQGTANASTGVISTPAFTLGRAVTDLNTEVIRSGWYADLPSTGERQISDATLPRLSTTLIFNSLYPGVSGSSGCTAAIDSGHTYTVDIATGNGTMLDSTVGLLGEAMIIERPDLSTKTPTDSTGRRVSILTSDVYQLGSQGWKKASTTTTAVVAGRLSWRQINNYLDLKNSP